MKEIWKPIHGCEGYAEVSNYGNIRTIERRVGSGKGFRLVESKILQGTKKGTGKQQCTVPLSMDNVKRVLNVGRVVYEAFHSVKLGTKMCIAHSDGNIMNNRLENLKVISRRSISSKDEISGVRKNKKGDTYSAKIFFQGRCIHLHNSHSQDECHKIYQLAKVMFEEFEKLKLGILRNSRINNKLIEKQVKL